VNHQIELTKSELSSVVAAHRRHREMARKHWFAMKDSVLPVDCDIVLRLNKLAMEERQCRVDGQTGHVERVYNRRGMAPGVFGCKIILDSGRVIYRDINDVAVF
jgi:hypothetical protein